jgi:hypothetical protein
MLLVLLPASPAPAAEQTAAVCNFVRHDTAKPGFENSPSKGRASGTGVLRCGGQIGGQQLSGEPGSLTVDYSYGTGAISGPEGDTCMFGSGSGVASVVLPLLGGKTLSLEGPFKFVTVGLTGKVEGNLGENTFTAMEVFPLEPDHLDENCTTKPLVHFMSVGTLVLTRP